MAEKTWVGATDDKTYATANNWLGAVAPVNNDDVIIQGDEPIAGSDQTAVNLDRFKVNPDYGKTIGSPDAYLQLNIDDELVFKGATGCTAYIDLSGAGDTPPLITVRGDGALYLKLEVPCAALYHKKGTVNIQEGTVTLYELSFLTNKNYDAMLVLYNGTITTLLQLGSQFIEDDEMVGSADVVTHNAHGGTATIANGDYQNLNGYGTTIRYNPAATDGLLDNLKMYAGLFDANGDTRAKTVTNAEQHGDAKIVADKGHVTFTNDIVVYGVTVPERGDGTYAVS